MSNKLPIRTFLSLPVEDKRIALQAFFFLQYHWLALRRTSVEKLQPQAVGNCTLPQKSEVPSVDNVVEIVRSVSWRFPWTNTCLIRSLASASILRRYGYRLQLRIGTRKTDSDQLLAHAWLEDAQGQVVAEELEDLAQYSRLHR